MIDVLLKSAEAVLTLFLIGFLGYALARKNWFGPESRMMIPRLVTIVALPPFLFTNILNVFDREQLVSLIYGSVVPALSIFFVFMVSLLFTRLLKVRKGRRGLFVVGCTSSNTMFIGVPVNITLFGPEALPYVLLYFFANTIFFWSVGNYSISLDGDREPEPLISLATAKRIVSPPLMGFGLGLLLVMMNVRPPAFFMSAAGYVGSLTTPLAIIFIGVTLAGISFRSLNLDRDVIAVLCGRFLLSPLAVITLTCLIDLPPMMAKVFTIQSSLPIVTSAALMAAYYQADASFASVIVSLSTVLSIATIPFYMVVISLINL